MSGPATHATGDNVKKMMESVLKSKSPIVNFSPSPSTAHVPAARAGAAAHRFLRQATSLLGGAPSEPDASPGMPMPGDAKPLSTAMKCVMSLLFLYFIIVVIMKAIIFTKQIKKLFADTVASASPTKTDDPDADKKEPLLDDEAKKEADKTTLPGGKAGEAAGAAVDTFKNMFSEEKLAKVMTNMAMVPMFCILITFCRLRARVDLETEPQLFAKTWMMVSTACLFVQILSCMLPDIPESAEGATKCCSLAKAWLYTLELVNLAGMVGLYAGIVIICYSIFGLRYKEDQVKGGGAPAAAAAAAGEASGTGSR